MPGLKLNKQQGTKNINDMIELRRNEELHRNVINGDETTPVSSTEEPEENLSPEQEPTNTKRSRVYEQRRESNGKFLRRKYEAGKPPRAHLELYREIVVALAGKKRDLVLLKPILAKLEISYVSSAKIFSLLEEYGYLYFERAPNKQGKPLIIEVLRDI